MLPDVSHDRLRSFSWPLHKSSLSQSTVIAEALDGGADLVVVIASRSETIRILLAARDRREPYWSCMHVRACTGITCPFTS